MPENALGIWICGCSLFYRREPELWASKSLGANQSLSLKILLVQKVMSQRSMYGFVRLKDISTPDFSTPSFNPRLFNHELSNPGLFNPRLFNHEFFNPRLPKSGVEKSGVEISFKLIGRGYLNPGLFNPGLFNHELSNPRFFQLQT